MIQTPMRLAACRRAHKATSDVVARITMYQLPIYPDGKMMELTRAGNGFTRRDRLAQETGGSFGNDGASIQRFPVRAVGGRL